MTTKTTTTPSGLRWRLARLRTALAFWLLRRGIAIEIEARHGAFRTRSKQLWKGGLVRVDIPLQKKHGTTSSPLGEITDPQGLIDGVTGKRPWQGNSDDIARRGAGCLPYLTSEQMADRNYVEKRIQEDDAKRRGKR